MENRNTNTPNNGDKNPNDISKFNSYWIYGIIALFLLGLHYMSYSDASNDQISREKLKEIISDVERIEVINERYAHIYIKESKLKDNNHSKAVKGRGLNPNRYHYWMEIGSVDSYEAFVKNLQAEKSIAKELIDYKTRENWLTPLLGWVHLLSLSLRSGSLLCEE